MAEPLESLVSQKSSDSGLHIQLHPLILLTISDHITRHAACQQQGPIVGALLGQQHGRDISLEHAFECVVMEGPNGEVQLPSEWFTERVQQFKDVHKDPPLDVVGWWSTAPPSGPNAVHLPIQRQILQDYNESAVFLAFHPSQLRASSPSGGKLPLSVYESVYEGDHHVADGGKRMQVDGEEQSLSIRFRELPYSVETGEAEMIGIDTISRSGRNATVEPRAVPSSQKQQPGGDKNGASKDKETEKAQKDEPVVLSQDQEELIASLHTRLNAIRTLESRITLIKSYVSSFADDSSKPDHLSHPILRNINALLTHLSLLTPHEQSALSAETRLQHEDVLLVSMLGQLNQSIRSMRDLGKKAAVLQNAKQGAMSRKAYAMQSRFEEEYLRDAPGSSEMFS